MLSRTFFTGLQRQAAASSMATVAAKTRESII
jgi:hypothetical protein